MKATYNITTNRFKVWFDERLSPEDYKRAKACNFVWYPGQKCFSSIWYPQAEDFIRSFGIEIEADDSPDDVAARVDRFADYADDAERSAESASAYAVTATTEKRTERALSRAASEAERAAYWTRRIAGSIAHAQYKDRPDVIARRIKGLETDLRRNMRSLEIKGKTEEHILTANNHWIENEDIEAMQENARRWIEHLNMRIEYEKAYLDAVGGTALLTPEKKPRRVAKAPEDGLKKGDTIKYNDGYYGQGKEHEAKIVSLGAHYVKVNRPDDLPDYYPAVVKVLRKFCKKVEA